MEPDADVALLARARRRTGGPSPAPPPRRASEAASRSRPTDRLAFSSTTLSGASPSTSSERLVQVGDRRAAVGCAADGHHLDAERCGEVAHPAVGVVAALPQLGHLAEHGHPTGCVDQGQAAQGRLHRGRIGVVGVVQDPQSRRCPPELGPQCAPLGRGHAGQGERRGRPRRTPRWPRRRRRWSPGGRPRTDRVISPDPHGESIRTVGRSSSSRPTTVPRTSPEVVPKVTIVASVRLRTSGPHSTSFRMA